MSFTDNGFHLKSWFSKICPTQTKPLPGYVSPRHANFFFFTQTRILPDKRINYDINFHFKFSVYQFITKKLWKLLRNGINPPKKRKLVTLHIFQQKRRETLHIFYPSNSNFTWTLFTCSYIFASLLSPWLYYKKGGN